MGNNIENHKPQKPTIEVDGIKYSVKSAETFSREFSQYEMDSIGERNLQSNTLVPYGRSEKVGRKKKQTDLDLVQ